jgi:tetratricopeptide (TPR) repeat protein
MSVSIFERISQAGPLNVVWGAGCSNSSNGLTWPILCLAELWRAGRIARLLSANTDKGVVTSTSLVNMLPDLYEKNHPELAAASTPSIYQVERADIATVARMVARGAQSGPWLVIGASGDLLGLADEFKNVTRFEHGLYWVGYYHQPAPASLGAKFFSRGRNAHFVGGFDPASFLAYLLREISGFPPRLVTDAKGTPCCGGGKVTPLQQLYRWHSAVESDFHRFDSNKALVARELWKKAETARDEEYERLLEGGITACELNFRLTGGAGWTGAVHLLRLAETRAPREAELLVRKGLRWIDERPAEQAMQHISAWTEADAFAILARSRTGAAADALFEKAVSFLSGLPRTQSLAEYRAASMAIILCRWADQERGANSDAVFERARQGYEESQQARYSPDRQFRFAEALRQRALALNGEAAQRMFADARKAFEPLLEKKPKDPGLLQFAGLLAVSQSRITEAESCMREAIALQPDHAADLLTSWASALGTARNFEEAEAIFRESERLKPDSRALRKNWSSILIWRARANPGAPDWWDRAKEQAEQAESIEAGSGAYNLACIAAELGDRDGVERWMSRAGEYGQMAGLSHVLRDESFEKVGTETWFGRLITQIFPSDPSANSSVLSVST